MDNPTPVSALASLVFPAVPPQAHLTQLALQWQLGRTEWLSPEEAKAAQWRQLTPLLAHAAQHSPYYRELFARAGIPPASLPDEGLFRRIPVSTRADLQAAGHALHSLVTPNDHGPIIEGKTSGSSGRPLHFRKTRVTGEIWSALSLREYFWHKRDFSKSIAAIRLFKDNGAPWPDGMKADNWGGVIGAVFPTGTACWLNVATPPAEQLAWLEKNKPAYLTSFPSNLAALSRHAQTTGQPLPPIEELRTTGETLSPEDLALIAESWKAKVTDMYTCEEIGYLALQCPDHPCYHVQSEHVILEILDEAGNPCSPGEVGRVVVTDLHNFATPFIRYDLGDFAEASAPCPCGRGLPTLSRIMGRTRGRLTLPDGRKIFPRLGERRLSDIPGVQVRQFKVIQRSRDAIELQIACDRPLDPREQKAVAAGLIASLGHPFEVSFSFPEQILPGPNGKFETFVSEVS
jgi:phenylacetate-CoA ligase